MGLYVKIERSVAIESLDAVDVTLWSLRTPSKEMLPSISQHNTSIFHSKLTCCIIVIGSAANIEFNPLIIFHSSFKTQRKKNKKKLNWKWWSSIEKIQKKMFVAVVFCVMGEHIFLTTYLNRWTFWWGRLSGRIRTFIAQTDPAYKFFMNVSLCVTHWAYVWNAVSNKLTL